MKLFRSLLAGIALAIMTSGAAIAQCGTTAPANKFCGNDTGSSALAAWKTIPAGALTPIGGGTVIGNRTGATAAPTAVTNPVLGIPGTSTGEVGFAGATSGTAILRAQAAAGSAVVLLPTGAGTLASSASAPLVLNATTGALSVTQSAMTKVDDANVTLTLGGSPSTALLAATSLTLGWTGQLSAPRGGTGQGSYALGDTLYASGASALSKLAGNITTAKQYLSQTGTGAVSAAPAWATIAGADITGAALTSSNDTNVTITLGGTPATSLLRATSLTMGWSGQLGLTRGGTNASLTASNGGLVYSSGSALAILAGTATANQIPLSGSSAAPSWSTATYPGTAAAGTVLAAASSNVVTATAQPTIGANGGTGGQITLNGATSGSAVVKVAAAAGSTNFQLPVGNGTSGFVLSTDGSGNTSWIASSGSTVAPQGRLSLTSGVAVPTADVSGATSVYWVPSGGQTIPVYNGSSFTNISTAGGAQLTLALDSNAAHSGYQQSGNNYDVFAFNNAGTLTIGTGPSWTAGAVAGSNTARGSGAGSTDLQIVSGIPTNANAITLRFGNASGNTAAVAANQATYLGSIRTVADGQVSDTALLRYVYNEFNQALRIGQVREATATWNYSTNSYRQANGRAANQVGVLRGNNAQAVHAQVISTVINSTATPQSVTCGIGISSTTVNSAIVPNVSATNSINATPQCTYDGYPGLGLQTVVWLERGAGADTQTWLGTSGILISGLNVQILQ